MAYIGPDGKGSPGVIPLRGTDANKARDAAGQKALKEVAPGSEFTQETPEELQAVVDRLDEIRTEMGNLYADLYAAGSGQGISWTRGIYQPPTRTKAGIQMEIDALSDEEYHLQARLNELYYAFPVMDEDNDRAEDIRDLGDATQPGAYTDGPARDAAKKKISPDQGRQ